MNVLGVLAVGVAVNTWGKLIFGLDQFPEWAQAALDAAEPARNGSAFVNATAHSAVFGL